MPCDQIRTTTLNFGKAHVGRLAAAMKARGWTVTSQHEYGFTATKDGVTTTFRDGEFETETGYRRTNPLDATELTEIRKEYQRQTLSYAAAKAGAVLKFTNAERTEGVLVKAGLGSGFGGLFGKK